MPSSPGMPNGPMPRPMGMLPMWGTWGMPASIGCGRAARMDDSKLHRDSKLSGLSFGPRCCILVEPACAAACHSMAQRGSACSISPGLPFSPQGCILVELVCAALAALAAWHCMAQRTASGRACFNVVAPLVLSTRRLRVQTLFGWPYHA
eukprot:1159167-Pelagomonas_calceolata.AAC.6